MLVIEPTSYKVSLSGRPASAVEVIARTPNEAAQTAIEQNAFGVGNLFGDVVVTVESPRGWVQDFSVKRHVEHYAVAVGLGRQLSREVSHDPDE